MELNKVNFTMSAAAGGAAAKSLQPSPTLCDPRDGSPLQIRWYSIQISSKALNGQAPPSLGSSKQEHWNGLPFPSPMSGIY